MINPDWTVHVITKSISCCRETLIPKWKDSLAVNDALEEPELPGCFSSEKVVGHEPLRGGGGLRANADTLWKLY